MTVLNIGLYPGIKRDVEARNIADKLKAKGFEVTIVGISEENDLDLSINGVMLHYKEAGRWIDTLLSSTEPVLSVPDGIHDDISGLWNGSLDDIDGDLGG
jgi:hypothetical protein